MLKETPTERRLREMSDVMHDMNGEAIDKGRQAIAVLRECELEWFPDLIASEIRALLTACQEDA